MNQLIPVSNFTFLVMAKPLLNQSVVSNSISVSASISALKFSLTLIFLGHTDKGLIFS